MKEEISLEESKEKAASFCAMSEKCTYDVKIKFKRWGIPEDQQEEVLDFLKKENFVNEARYATYYVRDKFRFNKWGKLKITAMLRAKQINDEIIELALSNIDQRDYQSSLYFLLSNKMETMDPDEDEFVQLGKIYRFAQMRGYELPLAKQTVERIKRNRARTQSTSFEDRY